MAKEAIVERIISDAQQEAQEIIAEAEARAAAVIAASSARAQEAKRETEQEVALRAKSIAEGKAATARLDSAKLMLGEKRRVIDVIYARALGKLLELGEKDCLALTEGLLKAYAEEGDEIVFAENYRYPEQAASLSVVRQKKLKVAFGRAKLDGGFCLRGTNTDKDLSYGALLAADREEHQAELAATLFRVR